MRESALGKFNAMAVAVAMAMGTVGYIQDVQAQAPAQVADARQYDIPAGNLADGLKHLSLKGRLQLLAPPELTTGLRGKAVNGTYTTREALDRLLEGTGLSYEFVNNSTVVVKKADKPPSSAPPSTSPSKQNSSASTPVTTNLDEVTVTGTRIRGGQTPSPVVTIGSERIAEEGFSDLGEVIRSIPQNFSGGQNPGVASGATSGAGGLSNQNITGGSSLNLRGLGPDATLTLLNGRRLSYGGFLQSVDISAIPVEAVERIEIVADGASAIYGSDAVGGVGNVILKRDFDGLTVGTRYGTTTNGGLTTREYTVTAGSNWTTGGLIATYKKESADPIYASDRAYTNYLPHPTTIYPGSDLISGLISLHQSFGDLIELRLDALRSKREQLYYNYYSGVSTYYNIFTPETTSTLLSPTIDILLPSDWTLTVGGAWGKDKRVQFESRTTLATGDSALQTSNCYCNESITYEVGGEGPVFSMPGGDVRLAVGIGGRKNEYEQTNYLTNAVTTKGDESARFVYAEINLPLIGSNQNIAGVHRLALTAAARAEDYDSFGGVTTPKLGLIYSPNADFTFKASWGKSFKAPTLYQRYYTRQVVVDRVENYGGVGYEPDATIILIGGGNPELGAERAKTWSTSIAFHPEILPGMEAELTWFNIDYTDRVVQPITSYTQAMSNPIYAEYVNTSPELDEIAETIATAEAFYNYTGVAYDPNNVAAIISSQYVNATRQKIKGLDISGSYRFDLGSSQLNLRSSFSWLDRTQQTAGTQNPYDLSGILFNPAKVNGRIGAVWNKGGFAASTFANYTSGLTNTLNNVKGASFTTFDATFRYSNDVSEGVWGGTEFALSVQNMLDRAPPLFTPTNNRWMPYDSTNYSAIGRFLSISVSKHF